MNTLVLPLNPHNPAHYLAALGITQATPGLTGYWDTTGNTYQVAHPDHPDRTALAAHLRAILTQIVTNPPFRPGDPHERANVPIDQLHEWHNRNPAYRALYTAMASAEVAPISVNKAPKQTKEESDTTPDRPNGRRTDIWSITGQVTLVSVYTELCELLTDHPDHIDAFVDGHLTYAPHAGSFYLDPDTGRRTGQYTRLRTTKEGATNKPAAPVVELLACIGLTFFPTYRAGTTGKTRHRPNKTSPLTYPIWTSPLTKDTIMTLIGQTNPDRPTNLTPTLTATPYEKGNGTNSYTPYNYAI